MRFEFGALPWELLGRRPVMLTLTYPGDWQRWVPDARVLHRHREALKERWRRRFGPPVGVWVVEFQRRGAPHLHLYLGLPDAVSDEEYRALQVRTMERRRAERQLGPYEARRQMRAPSGEFGLWVRTAWWEIVGSKSRAHHGRGVDLAVAFYSERAEAEANRVRVAEYFWRESGKWAQKQPPEDFGSLKFYGRWGQKQGFHPVVDQTTVSEKAFYELRRVLRRAMEGKQRALAERNGHRFRPKRRRLRGRDGLTVFGIDGTIWVPRLQAWAEQVALDKLATRPADETIQWRGPLTLRAFSELEVDPDADLHEMIEHEAAWDPDEEYQRYLAHEEALIEAEIEAMERRRAGQWLGSDDRA